MLGDVLIIDELFQHVKVLVGFDDGISTVDGIVQDVVLVLDRALNQFTTVQKEMGSSQSLSKSSSQRPMIRFMPSRMYSLQVVALI